MSVVLGALISAGAAPGATPPPPEDVPAVSAYTELFPTSGGSRSPRVGAKGRAKLPPNVKQKLAREGGSDAALLEKIATAREYGAPPTPSRNREGQARARRLDLPRDETPLGAGLGVVTSGGNDRIVLLGALLLLLTAVLAGAALYRRSRSAAS